MITDSLFYPPVGFHFAVIFDKFLPMGILDMRFQEVSGLNAELTVEEFMEGGENRFSHKLPGRTKFPNLVLKRGMQIASIVSGWAQDCIYNLDISTSNVQVILLNEFHVPLAMWNFHSAYPVKFSVSDFKAQENTIVIESLELAYQYGHKVSLDSLISLVPSF